MKITKSKYIKNIFETNKVAANKGCNVCPICGESRKFYVEGNELKGISCGCEKTWHEGFIRMRSMKCDCYNCFTCGAEWESEPYQWN